MFNAHRRPLVDVPVDPTPPGRDYYVATGGSGDGLTSGAPMSLATFISATLNPDDQIFFNRGDEFNLDEYEIGVPGILVDAYGTGDNPVFTGSQDISGLTWTDEGDGSWSASMAVRPKWIAIGDSMARMSESDWIPITNVVATDVRRVSAATINALPESIVGAVLFFKEYSFRLSYERTVLAYNSTNGNITFSPALTTGTAAVGMPLKLFNQRQFMSLDGDWCWVAGTLYVQSTASPATLNIREVISDYGFYFNASSNSSISNVEMKHYKLNGATFSNLTINRIGIQDSIGFSIVGLGGTGGTAITPVPDLSASGRANDLITEDCTIDSVGYQGMQVFGVNHIIRRNKISNYCMRWTDGGAIHLYANTSWRTENVLMQNNIIFNGIGNDDGIAFGGGDILAGIYCDAGTANCIMDNNFIFDPGDYGIFVNSWTTANTITDNKISGGIIHQVQIRQELTPNVSYTYSVNENCVFTGNILVSKFTPSRDLVLYNDDGTTDFNPFSSIDNNHYAQPYSTNINKRTSNGGSSYTEMTLATWKTYIGSDASSTSYVNHLGGNTPNATHVNDEYNYTNAPVDFNVPAGYEDVYGNAFSNPVSIPAYEGLIQLKETP
jgi:hypothetical protein